MPWGLLQKRRSKWEQNKVCESWCKRCSSANGCWPLAPCSEETTVPQSSALILEGNVWHCLPISYCARMWRSTDVTPDLGCLLAAAIPAEYRFNRLTSLMELHVSGTFSSSPIKQKTKPQPARYTHSGISFCGVFLFCFFFHSKLVLLVNFFLIIQTTLDVGSMFTCSHSPNWRYLMAVLELINQLRCEAFMIASFCDFNFTQDFWHHIIQLCLVAFFHLYLLFLMQPWNTYIKMHSSSFRALPVEHT